MRNNCLTVRLCPWYMRIPDRMQRKCVIAKNLHTSVTGKIIWDGYIMGICGLYAAPQANSFGLGVKRRKRESRSVMSVTLMCPNLRCRKVLAVPEAARGKRVRCSYCGTMFMVPKQPLRSQRSRIDTPAVSKQEK